MRRALQPEGIGLVQFVAPTTPPERAARLCESSEGFVYALTSNGITGRHAALPEATLAYLAKLRRHAQVPVCAGFGIRDRQQVERLAGHVDGVIVGSALVEAMERGIDAGEFVRSLRAAQAA